MLRRQIDDDEPIGARRLGVGEEARHAIAVDRIVIAHKHDRRCVVAGAESAHDGERPAKRHAGAERAQARRLDRRPIRHRVGERHADLDEIGAGLGQACEERREGRGIGIAAGEICHEPGAAFAAERGEAPCDARLAHGAAPVALATVSRSLSPRPERLITMR